MKKRSKIIKGLAKNPTSFFRFSKRDSLFMMFGILTIIAVGMYHIGTSRAGPSIPCPGFFCQYDTTNYSPQAGDFDRPTLRFDGWTLNGLSGTSTSGIPVDATISVTMGYKSLTGTSQHVFDWTNINGGNALLANLSASGGQDNIAFPDLCFNMVYDQQSPYYTPNWATTNGGKIYCNVNRGIAAGNEIGKAVDGGASVVWYMSNDIGSQVNRETAFHFSATVKAAGQVCVRNHVSVTDDPQAFQPGVPRSAAWIANSDIRRVVGIAGAVSGDSAPLCLNFVPGPPPPPPPIRSVDCHFIVVEAGNPAYYGRSFHLRFHNLFTNEYFDGPFGWNPGTTYTINTFDMFRFLYPHYSYTTEIVFEDGGVGNGYSLPLSYCMSAQCLPPSLNTDPVSLEPGESGLARYGMTLTDAALRDFGEYSVRLTPRDGITRGGTDGRTFNSGAPTNNTDTTYDGPFTVTANYTGYAVATLMFNGAVANGMFGGGFSCQSDPYTPQTRPYINVKSGDISAGGGFKYKNGTNIQCPAATDQRFVSPVSGSGDSSYGGIRTFANASTFTGSSADFGAYSMGIISHDSTDPFRAGFNTRTVNPSPRILAFANTGGVGEGGGLLGGNNPSVTMHCRTDFFDETQTPDIQNMGAGATIDLGSVASGQYLYKPAAGQTVNIHGTVAGGKQITIYVDSGNVLLDGDINYGNWGFDLTKHTNNAPYLAVVAKGNIHVQPNVSKIEGFFIAQPTDDAKNGVFSTCSLGTSLPTTGSIVSACRSQLTINGSVTAQHFYPLRAFGTLIASGAGERVNFTPSTIIGQPNFLPRRTGLEGLNNLPPVF